MDKIKSTHLFSTILLLSGLAALLAINACGNTSTEGNAAAENADNSGDPYAKFRTGRFKYGDAAKFGDFVITRTADSQVDSGAITQLVVKFDLEWETDTSYVLTYKEMVANPQNIELPDLEGMNRHCHMSEPDDTSYMEVSTSSLSMDTVTMHTRIVLRK